MDERITEIRKHLKKKLNPMRYERCLRGQEKRNAGLNRDSKTARCEKS